MSHSIIYPILVLMLLSSTTNISIAQDNKGFIDFNGYYDTREYSTLTINILSNLPNRFQYFSLTNYQSANETADLESYYSEHNLRWQISKNSPFDLTHQFVMRQGPRNDDFRFGVRWRLNNTSKLGLFFKKINTSFSINPMFIEFREHSRTKYMTVIEYVYRINVLPKILKNRIYISGFADQNFFYNNGKATLNWVSEHQAGIKIVDNLYAIAEYRMNDFLTTDNHGLGYGLEYKIKF